MRVALVIPRITADVATNLATIERMATDAESAGAGLVLLPEAVLTGLANNDNPAHDLPLGQPIPGPATDRLGHLCRRRGIWLAFGLLEREGDRLYDSAVLLGPDGSVCLRYRRNQSQWHARGADPAVYCEGSTVRKAETPMGTVGFLICGDLFDDGVVDRFSCLRAEWLLMPMARCFPDGTADQSRWDAEELPKYLARVRLAQTPALIVNYLADPSLDDDDSFGGAFVVSAQGALRASHPLGQEGILLAEA